MIEKQKYHVRVLCTSLCVIPQSYIRNIQEKGVKLGFRKVQ
jgi:hypothetical protein